VPLAGHGLRPTTLRRRAGRPQLKRDPLDGCTSSHPPEAPLITDWAPHVDHARSQLIKLHYHMRRAWYRFYPDTVRRACRVAYASHLRALLEFFHNGRPSRSRLEGAGCEPTTPDQDITFRDMTPRSAPLRDWTNPELLRLCDADKLVGHISRHRGARIKLENWGSDADLDLWRANAKTLLAAVDPALLPNASEAARCYGI